MQIEIIAIVLSVVSTIVTFIDLYLNQFRRGRVAVPPVRAYRLEPLNFHSDGESYRGLRLTAALTFMNTGALSRAVDNLRIKIEMPDGDSLILDWRNECEAIEQPSHESRLATQPTLGPYESLAKIYAFVSPYQPEDGKRVSKLEQYGTDHPERRVKATLEMLAHNRWIALRGFSLKHNGTNMIEIDFDRINR